MNRLTTVSIFIAAVFAAATAVQTFRLWQLQDEAKALRVAAAGQEKDARKTAAGKGTPRLDDDSWSPIADRSAKAKGAETAANAKTGGMAAASATDGTQEDGKPGERGKKAEIPKNVGQPPATPKAAAAPDGVSQEQVTRSQDLVNAAQQYIKTGNFAQAREKLRQSVQENALNADAWRQLASVDRQLGNTEEELQAYQKWMEAAPEDRIARYMAAEAYARNGMGDQALQYLSDFQQLSQGDPQSWAMTAGIYQQMNMTAEQGDALVNWTTAAPNSPDAHRALGSYYQRMGQIDQAIAQYQASAALEPNNPAPYVDLGNTYMQTGQPEAALQQFQTAVNVRPNNVEALSRLAYTERQLGDLQGALTTFQRIVDLEPGSQAGQQAASSIQSIQQQQIIQAQQQAQ